MKKVELNSYDLSDEDLYLLMPDYFYKYSTINNNLKDSIANGRLWYNTSSNFNDPFDCRAYLNFGSTEKECRKNFDKFNRAFNNDLPEINKKVWNHLLKKPNDFNLMNSYSAANNIEKSIGVTCFSENYNNTLMWSHYADSHKGLVLEFKKDINGSLSRKMLPVNYFENYPIINVSDYTEEQMISIVYQVICAKGIDWEYENEWRAITANGSGLEEFDKSELSGVIFGLNTEENHKKEIFDLIQKSGYSKITFKEAEFQSRKFVVNYKKYKPK
ncbi:DUF2971 domain-containing protein [Winogradskyella aurantiaca]|uniref:DUF2971 domain-containing protein n=1 Tax=Winogradskyella aurantiaca TaxID=2219558 RepID=UPI000E1CACF4|nr:DUF2971 domain-containing protein [Winogradskyella aurantiaca]